MLQLLKPCVSSVPMLALLGALAVLPTCINGLHEQLYDPVITFKGFYKDHWLELPGTFDEPNTCEMRADTVVIFCYSEDFSRGAMYWTGYMLKMEIHPFTIDTSKDFATEHLRVRFSDFAVGQNQTTTVLYPQDTLYSVFTASGIVEAVERREDGRIEISEIYVPMHNENQSGLAATIKSGELSGTVKR